MKSPKEANRMKFSSKCEACSLSPIRKFHPCVVAAEAAGRRVLHLNIGQPDVETPQAFFDAVRDFREPVLAYAPAGGVEEYVEAVRDYYQSFGVSLAPDDILATFGGSEALQLASPSTPTTTPSSASPAEGSSPSPPRRRRATASPAGRRSSPSSPPAPRPS